MPKFLVSILLVVYFTVSTGFVVNLHYCMDKMASIELGTSDADECGKCGMPATDKDGCCRDEVRIIKLQQDQSPAFFTLFHFLAQPALVTTAQFLLLPYPNTVHQPAQRAHAPPVLHKQYTYLANCVFRL